MVQSTSKIWCWLLLTLDNKGKNRAGVNDDGVVNIADLVLVASALGKAAIEVIQSFCIRAQNPWQIKKLVYLLQKAV